MTDPLTRASVESWSPPVDSSFCAELRDDWLRIEAENRRLREILGYSAVSNRSDVTWTVAGSNEQLPTHPISKSEARRMEAPFPPEEGYEPSP